MSSNSENILKVSGTLIVLGGTFLYRGLKKLKIRRKIKDIPTSKIDTAAIGELVEVKGKIVASSSEQVLAPISNKSCAAYRWNLQYYYRSKNSSGWRDYKSFCSHNYIFINDGGKSNAAIKLSDVEVHGGLGEKIVKFSSSNFSLPEKAKRILNLEKMLDTTKKSFFLFSTDYRIIETCFYTDRFLYVLGSLSPKDELLEQVNVKKSAKQKKELNRFEKLIRRPIIIKRYDKNNDGYLDIEEQKAVIEHLDESFKEYIKDLEVNEFDRVKAFFQKSKVPLGIFDSNKVHISLKREGELLSKIGTKSWLMILAGPPMIAFGIMILVKGFI